MWAQYLLQPYYREYESKKWKWEPTIKYNWCTFFITFTYYDLKKSECVKAFVQWGTVPERWWAEPAQESQWRRPECGSTPKWGHTSAPLDHPGRVKTQRHSKLNTQDTFSGKKLDGATFNVYTIKHKTRHRRCRVELGWINCMFVMVGNWGFQNAFWYTAVLRK